MPEQKTRPPATIAWLYGPSAAGAWSLDTACRVIGRLYAAQRDRSSRSAIGPHVRLEVREQLAHAGREPGARRG